MMMTDVRPSSGGSILATCECGLDCIVASEAAGWDWALVHACRTPIEPGPT
jgi:hypothetical protein